MIEIQLKYLNKQIATGKKNHNNHNLNKITINL
jgi:hypothetical protein